MNLVEQLFAALLSIPDLRRGLCVGDDPTLWDATSGPAVERNRAICAQCVEQSACAAWARTQGRGKLTGVVGRKLYGGDPQQRAVS